MMRCPVAIPLGYERCIGKRAPFSHGDVDPLAQQADAPVRDVQIEGYLAVPRHEARQCGQDEGLGKRRADRRRLDCPFTTWRSSPSSPFKCRKPPPTPRALRLAGFLLPVSVLRSLVDRRKSCTPTLSSRRVIALDTAEGVRPQSFACGREGACPNDLVEQHKVLKAQSVRECHAQLIVGSGVSHRVCRTNYRPFMQTKRRKRVMDHSNTDRASPDYRSRASRPYLSRARIAGRGFHDRHAVALAWPRFAASKARTTARARTAGSRRMATVPNSDQKTQWRPRRTRWQKRPSNQRFSRL